MLVTNFIPILYPTHLISVALRAPQMACSGQIAPPNTPMERAHNPEVAGSNPAPATPERPAAAGLSCVSGGSLIRGGTEATREGLRRSGTDESDAVPTPGRQVRPRAGEREPVQRQGRLRGARASRPARLQVGDREDRPGARPGLGRGTTRQLHGCRGEASA